MLDLKDVPQEQPRDYPAPDSVNVRLGEIDFNTAAEVMGLEDKNLHSKYRDKINTLLDWVKTKGEVTPENIRIALRNLQTKVGSPGIYENRISYLARWAYLDMQEQKIKSEKESIGGNDES